MVITDGLDDGTNLAVATPAAGSPDEIPSPDGHGQLESLLPQVTASSNPTGAVGKESDGHNSYNETEVTSVATGSVQDSSETESYKIGKCYQKLCEPPPAGKPAVPMFSGSNSEDCLESDLYGIQPTALTEKATELAVQEVPLSSPSVLVSAEFNPSAVGFEADNVTVLPHALVSPTLPPAGNPLLQTSNGSLPQHRQPVLPPLTNGQPVNLKLLPCVEQHPIADYTKATKAGIQKTSV